MIGNNYKNNKPNTLTNPVTYQHIIRRLLYIIGFDQLAMMLTFPLITLIFFDTHSSLFAEDTPLATRSLWYGFVNALPNTVNIFFSPILSALSDVYGRRKLLLLEIASSLLFAALMAYGILIGSMSALCLAFFIRGAFARTNPTALAIIGDVAPPQHKILLMGYLQFAISVAAFLGPILGGYIAVWFFFPSLNYASAFFVVGGLTIINFCLAYRYIIETLQHKITLRTLHKHAFKGTLLRKEVLQISLVLLLIQLAWSTYYQFIPPLLKTEFDFASRELGVFIGMIAFWLALASRFGIEWLQYFCNAHQILVSAIYLVCIGFVITLVAISTHNLSLLWLSAIPVAMGDVITYACLTARYSNIVGQNAQGAIMGFSFVVTRVAWTLTSVVGGYFISFSPLALFGLGFLCIICSAFLVRQPFAALTPTSHSVNMR